MLLRLHRPISLNILCRKSFQFKSQRFLCSQLNSKMLKAQGDTGQEIISEAVVKEISRLSETVKLLKLEVRDEKFSFKSGQWVDMFIPGVPVVGGFSMCSAPHLLKSSRMLHLAIKYSSHPPSHWIHTQCQAGDKLNLRAGGDFFYAPDPDSVCRDLVLIAGGVGINPLFSMLQHFLHIHQDDQHSPRDSSKNQTSKVALLYSAQNTDELIFKNELLKLSEQFDQVTVRLFSTRELVTEDHLITNGRITFKDVQSLLSEKQITQTKVYICGPSSFIETIEMYCTDAGFDKNFIHIERWW